ncbi:ABC transporter substrate-binding protein [Sporichthya polymorpha]|uniref:ABC transporter substrate-binding protein n=1 Tax=Sporichthya polymorpha TaxID=35751 RepID=UPI00039E1B04|nr:ABC transporter substrate-binding protein [Sporichthya polymorpha]
MSRSLSRGRRAVIAVVAGALVLSGCGGTRVTDEAIQAAVGIRADEAPVPAAVAGAAAPAPDVAVAPAAPDAVDVGSAPNTADPVAPTGAAATTATRGDIAAAGRPAARPSEGRTATGPKSVVRLGAVGTFSGPVGSLVKDTVTGLRVWSQAVNAAGGVNGHPIELLVGDDGGDPARYYAMQKQFVEQQGVLAFLFNTVAYAPAGNNKYLDTEKIYTFGTDGGLELPYTNPYVLTATPAGLTLADGMMLALSKALNAKGRSQGPVKLAAFACSDFGLCDNFDRRWSNPDVLRKSGFELVARGRPSLTQPDFTSQCLAAEQAGATTILLGMDSASIRRFAGNCARQNYRPQFATADIVVTRDLPLDPTVDGLLVATKMAPFTDLRVPGVAEAHRAFTRFLPGQVVTGGMVNGWIIGEFFAQAAKDLPDNPTRADLADGLYRLQNNDLKGMTYPITLTRGKPAPRHLCYGLVAISGKKFTTAPGPSLDCVKNGRPLASLDDY